MTYSAHYIIIITRDEERQTEKGNEMSVLSEARQEARELGVKFGKFTSDKDSQGEYTLYEDGRVVAEGYFDTAAEIKADYIRDVMYERIDTDF